MRGRVVVAVALALTTVLVSAGCCCFHIADDAYRAHMKTAFSPGAETGSLDALDPEFRARVERVVKKLEEKGYHPEVRSTYRSARRQDAMYTFSRTKEMFGASPGTRARGGESCHNHTDERGLPASLAADVIPGEEDRKDSRSRARFYWALGKAAKQEGLVWGGSWAKTNPTWRKYGLGWDPPHVQAKSCTWDILQEDRRLYAGDDS